MKYTVLLTSAIASAAAAAGTTIRSGFVGSTITSAFTIKLECTATPLPNDCIANDYSNTVEEITFTSGQVIYYRSTPNVLSALPTITAPARPSGVNGTGSGVSTGSPTPTESGKPEETKNAGDGREVRVVGAMLGGLVAGLAAL